MEIGYCTLSKLAKAVNEFEQKTSTEDDMMILLYKISYGFYQLQMIGIAHRDMKPENIMINEGIECVKLIDIGEA